MFSESHAPIKETASTNTHPAIESIASEKEPTIGEKLLSKNQADQYYESFPEGLCRDAVKALNQTARYEYITSKDAPEELRELFDRVADTIEDEKDIRSLAEIILRAIRDETQEAAIREADQEALEKARRKLSGLDGPASSDRHGMHYNFDSIRAKLEAVGVSLKERKSSNSFQ